MIMKGSNLKDQDKSDSQACLTIGHVLVYSTKKRASRIAGKTRHIGVNEHAQTSSKKLVQQLYHMGISIPYDKIMQIEDWFATSACECFEADGAVATACLWKGPFTVGTLDNLDLNPSLTSTFDGKGKKSAWQAWQTYDDATEVCVWPDITSSCWMLTVSTSRSLRD